MSKQVGRCKKSDWSAERKDDFVWEWQFFFATHRQVWMMCPADRAILKQGYKEIPKWTQMIIFLVDIVAGVDTV